MTENVILLQLPNSVKQKKKVSSKHQRRCLYISSKTQDQILLQPFIFCTVCFLFISLVCTIYHVPYATLSIFLYYIIIYFFILCFIFLHVLICIFVISCVHVYIYIYILFDLYLYFYILLLVFSVICMHQGKRVTQFQFSVCMYGTCGRIDNKADFDFFDFDYQGFMSKLIIDM